MEKNKNIISERIKKLRKEKGYTQEQLANKLGLNAKSSIANYESGANSPSDDIKIKMCNIFDISLDYLLGVTSYKKPVETLENNLNKLNMTELEYNDLINTFQTSSTIKITLSELLNLSNPSDCDERKTRIINTVLDIVLEYLPDVSDESNDNKLDDLIESRERRIKNLVNSLNKNKILKSTNEFPFLNEFYMCPVYGRISAGMPNWVEECIEGRIPLDPEMFGISDPEKCFFLKVNGESMNEIIKNGAFALIKKQDYVENGDIAVVLVNGFDATLKKFTKQNNLIILEPLSNIKDDTEIKTQVYDEYTEIKILGKYIGKFEFTE